jgi:NADPH:quinone reductase-like Zn-dependent oxidoreductase
VLVTIAYPPEPVPSAPGVRVEPLIMSPDPGQLARIGELVAAGEVQVEIAEVLALADVRRAHVLSESRHVRGKIVLTVP